MQDEVIGRQSLFSSELAPGPAQKRLALFFIFLLLAIYALVSGPFAYVRLSPTSAFAPAYIASMFVNDSITSVLLFAQYSILRSRSLLVIASGYLFTALITIPWVMTIYGGLAPTGVIGGVQSPAWIYISWHSGFAIFVISYALLKDTKTRKRYWQRSARASIVLSVSLTMAVVVTIAFVTIAGEAMLPEVVLPENPFQFNTEWPHWIGGLTIVILSMIAISVLWVRRRSMIDLWLMVVMLLYALEIPLTYYPTPFRYSLGWYTVRVYGFFSSILLLIVLLYEITTIYGRLLRAVRAQLREREARLVTGDAVAATIVHEVKQPLSAMMLRAQTSLSWLDRAIPDLGRAKAELENLSADGNRAAAVIERVRASFRQDAQIRTSLNLDDLIGETIALLLRDFDRHRIEVHVEPSTRHLQVEGDPIQLQQVLLNLITNAIDAMANKEGPRILSVRSEVDDQGGVSVSVADTGAGIAAHDIEKIFNPLFTTKANGMGMGLAICRSIIEAHDGLLLVDSNSAQGTTFKFLLRPATVAGV